MKALHIRIELTQNILENPLLVYICAINRPKLYFQTVMEIAHFIPKRNIVIIARPPYLFIDDAILIIIRPPPIKYR